MLYCFPYCFSCDSLRQYGNIYVKADCAPDWPYKVEILVLVDLQR